jgi:hypothetical protein
MAGRVKTSPAVRFFEKVKKEYGVSLHVVKDIARRRNWQSLSSTAHD